MSPSRSACASEGAEIEFDDRFHGRVRSAVDDFVIRRADGTAAYNLAVVVDDADQGVDQVVRGDDLVHTTPRQVFVQRLLGLPTPEYVHVALVYGPDGERLAKRHGAISLGQCRELGEPVASVVARLAASIGLAEPGERLDATEVLRRFDPGRLAVAEQLPEPCARRVTWRGPAGSGRAGPLRGRSADVRRWGRAPDAPAGRRAPARR